MLSGSSPELGKTLPCQVVLHFNWVTNCSCLATRLPVSTESVVETSSDLDKPGELLALNCVKVLTS